MESSRLREVSKRPFKRSLAFVVQVGSLYVRKHDWSRDQTNSNLIIVLFRNTSGVKAWVRITDFDFEKLEIVWREFSVGYNIHTTCERYTIHTS